MLHVPSLYQMLMNNPLFAKIDFSFNKVCISGASPFSREGIEALESYIGKGKLVEIYGMTEASPLISMNPFKGKKKPGSVGVPLQDTMVRIVDIESGTKDVSIGEAGEIIVQGPQVMKGYHNKPEETAHALRRLNGGTWLFTGDIARMDEEGFIYLVDRSKDMLNVGGFKVFSREVEEALYRHPDVEFCAIVGIPDPKRSDSEIVKAVIQLTKYAKAKRQEDVRDGIAEYCKENLAPYKNPKQIEFVEAMPLTAVGKVDKKALKQRAAY
jgi:acyl-CoA synthetase (AMP-forming)/AMP-acid ligase II